MGRDGRCPPKTHAARGQEVSPPHLLSPPCVLREPARLQGPSGGPGLDGGAPPGRLHQPHGVPQGLVEVPPQQPAHGREVGEIPMAQVFCSRKEKKEAGKKAISRLFLVFLEVCCTHQPSGWTTANRCAPGPPAPCQSGRAPRQRRGYRGSEWQQRAPGWRWRSREGSGAGEALPCLIPA